jgi:hypothetical protein
VRRKIVRCTHVSQKGYTACFIGVPLEQARLQKVYKIENGVSMGMEILSIPRERVNFRRGFILANEPPYDRYVAP